MTTITTTNLRLVLGFQAVPILLSCTQTLAGKNAVPTDASATVPLAVLHVMGMSSLSLGILQMVVAITGPRSQVRTVLMIAVPMKLIAAGLFGQDGMKGVAIWEGLTGVLNGICAFFA